MSDLAMSGVFTGIDTNKIVQAIMARERGGLQRLETRKASYEQKKAAASEIERRMRQLRDKVDELNDARDLRAVRARTGDTDVVGVSASSGATEGSHTVTVNQLATAERRVHDGVASESTLVGEGKLVYTYNGQTRTVLTNAETTLEDLAGLINNDADNPGVTASILEHEVDADHVYHLVLSGDDSGSDYTITIDGSTTLSGFGDASFTTTQSARDSQVRVDGYPETGWIERSSNTLTEVIPGVSLELQGTGTTTVSLSRNTQGLKEDLRNLVSIYNGIVSKLDEYTGYDEETKEGGILQGDAAINGLVQQIRSELTGSVSGFQDGQDSFTLPAQLGFEIDRYGELTLDESVLDDALSEDYYGSLALIGADRSGASDDDYVQFTSAGSATVPGVYDVKVEFDAGGNITAGWMRAEGETTWREATVSGSQIEGASGEDEEDLVVTAFQEGAETERTATVRVQQGFAGAMYERLEDILDATDGALKIKKDQYSSAIERIDRSIERQEDRLEDKETRLREKYARLETTLARMDSQRASLQAMIQSLPSGGGGVISSMTG